MCWRGWMIAALLPLLAGCDQDKIQVAGPFYLTYFETYDQMALFRCPGPNTGCAGEGLPGSTVFAAGADKKYIVAARHPWSDHNIDRSVTQYYYFARIRLESGGWGDNPEKIVGPLDKQEFDAATASLHLPPLSIVLDDLK